MCIARLEEALEHPSLDLDILSSVRQYGEGATSAGKQALTNLRGCAFAVIFHPDAEHIFTVAMGRWHFLRLSQQQVVPGP